MNSSRGFHWILLRASRCGNERWSWKKWMWQWNRKGGSPPWLRFLPLASQHALRVSLLASSLGDRVSDRCDSNLIFLTPIFHVTTILWWNSRFGLKSPFHIFFMLRRPGSSTFSFFRSPLFPARENLLPLTEAVVLFSKRLLITAKLMIFHTDPTEATYRHYLIIDGQSISLDVMDTAGKVGFKFKTPIFVLFFCLYSMCCCRFAYKDFAEKACHA